MREQSCLFQDISQHITHVQTWNTTSNGDFNLLNEFSKVKNWKCDSFFFLIVSGELGGNVTDRKQGSGMFGQRGPRKTPAPARQQMSFVFVYLCSCICICIWWETTENNVSRVGERHLREPDTKLTSSEWRRGGILSVTGVGGRSPDTRLTTNHRSSFAEIASGMQLTPWSIHLCHRSFGKPLPTNLNAVLWESTPKVNVRHVIWKGKWRRSQKMRAQKKRRRNKISKLSSH